MNFKVENDDSVLLMIPDQNNLLSEPIHHISNIKIHSISLLHFFLLHYHIKTDNYQYLNVKILKKKEKK